MLNFIKPIVILLLTLTFIASADGSDLQIDHSIISIDISSTQDSSTGKLDQLAKKTINKAIDAAMTKQLQPALQILDKHQTRLDNEIKSAQNDADATNEKINTLNIKINTAHTACKSSLGWASFICSDQTSDLDLYFRSLTFLWGDKANQWKSAKRKFDDLRSKLKADITTLTKQLAKENQRLADLTAELEGLQATKEQLSTQKAAYPVWRDADNAWSSGEREISAVSMTNSNLRMGNFNQPINQLSKAKELLESITQITEKALRSAKSDCKASLPLLNTVCNWSEDWISTLKTGQWWDYYSKNLSIDKDIINDAKGHVEKLHELYNDKNTLDNAKQQIKRLTAYTESVFDNLSAFNISDKKRTFTIDTIPPITEALQEQGITVAINTPLDEHHDSNSRLVPAMNLVTPMPMNLLTLQGNIDTYSASKYSAVFSTLNTANSSIKWLGKDEKALYGSGFTENWQAGAPITLEISLKDKEGYAYTEYDYKDDLMLIIRSESGDIIAKKALSTLDNFSNTNNAQYTATHYLTETGRFTLSVTLQGQHIGSPSDQRSISINVNAADDISVHKTVLTAESEEGNGHITFEFTPKDRFNNIMTDEVFTDLIYLVRSRKGGTTYEHMHSYDTLATAGSGAEATRNANNESISFNYQENDPGIWRYMLAFDLKDIDESSDIAPIGESLDLTETSSIDLTADVTHAVEIDLSHLPEQDQSGMYNPKRIKYVRANPQHQYDQYLYQRQIQNPEGEGDYLITYSHVDIKQPLVEGGGSKQATIVHGITLYDGMQRDFPQNHVAFADEDFEAGLVHIDKHKGIEQLLRLQDNLLVIPKTNLAKKIKDLADPNNISNYIYNVHHITYDHITEFITQEIANRDDAHKNRQALYQALNTAQVVRFNGYNTTFDVTTAYPLDTKVCSLDKSSRQQLNYQLTYNIESDDAVLSQETLFINLSDIQDTTQMVGAYIKRIKLLPSGVIKVENFTIGIDGLGTVLDTLVDTNANGATVDLSSLYLNKQPLQDSARPIYTIEFENKNAAHPYPYTSTRGKFFLDTLDSYQNRMKPSWFEENWTWFVFWGPKLLSTAINSFEDLFSHPEDVLSSYLQGEDKRQAVLAKLVKKQEHSGAGKQILDYLYGNKFNAKNCEQYIEQIIDSAATDTADQANQKDTNAYQKQRIDAWTQVALLAGPEVVSGLAEVVTTTAKALRLAISTINDNQRWAYLWLIDDAEEAGDFAGGSGGGGFAGGSGSGGFGGGSGGGFGGLPKSMKSIENKEQIAQLFVDAVQNLTTETTTAAFSIIQANGNTTISMVANGALYLRSIPANIKIDRDLLTHNNGRFEYTFNPNEDVVDEDLQYQRCDVSAGIGSHASNAVSGCSQAIQDVVDVNSATGLTLKNSMFDKVSYATRADNTFALKGTLALNQIDINYLAVNASTTSSNRSNRWTSQKINIDGTLEPFYRYTLANNSSIMIQTNADAQGDRKFLMTDMPVAQALGGGGLTGGCCSTTKSSKPKQGIKKVDKNEYVKMEEEKVDEKITKLDQRNDKQINSSAINWEKNKKVKDIHSDSQAYYNQLEKNLRVPPIEKTHYFYEYDGNKLQAGDTIVIDGKLKRVIVTRRTELGGDEAYFTMPILEKTSGSLSYEIRLPSRFALVDQLKKQVLVLKAPMRYTVQEIDNDSIPDGSVPEQTMMLRKGLIHGNNLRAYPIIIGTLTIEENPTCAVISQCAVISEKNKEEKTKEYQISSFAKANNPQDQKNIIAKLEEEINKKQEEYRIRAGTSEKYKYKKVELDVKDYYGEHEVPHYIVTLTKEETYLINRVKDFIFRYPSTRTSQSAAGEKLRMDSTNRRLNSFLEKNEVASGRTSRIFASLLYDTDTDFDYSHSTLVQETIYLFKKMLKKARYIDNGDVLLGKIITDIAEIAGKERYAQLMRNMQSLLPEGEQQTLANILSYVSYPYRELILGELRESADIKKLMLEKSDAEILLKQLKVGAVTGKGVLDRLSKMGSYVRSIDNLSMQALIGEIIKFYYEKYTLLSIYHKGFQGYYSEQNQTIDPKKLASYELKNIENSLSKIKTILDNRPIVPFIAVDYIDISSINMHSINNDLIGEFEPTSTNFNNNNLSSIKNRYNQQLVTVISSLLESEEYLNSEEYDGELSIPSLNDDSSTYIIALKSLVELMSKNSFLVSLLNESIKTDDTKKAMVAVIEGILKARNDSSDMSDFEKYIHAAASSIVSSDINENQISSIAQSDAPADAKVKTLAKHNLSDTFFDPTPIKSRKRSQSPTHDNSEGFVEFDKYKPAVNDQISISEIHYVGGSDGEGNSWGGSHPAFYISVLSQKGVSTDVTYIDHELVFKGFRLKGEFYLNSEDEEELIFDKIYTVRHGIPQRERYIYKIPRGKN